MRQSVSLRRLFERQEHLSKQIRCNINCADWYCRAKSPRLCLVRSKLVGQKIDVLRLRRLTSVLHGEIGGAVLLQQHLQIAALLERLIAVIAGYSTTDVMILNCVFRFTATKSPGEYIEPKEVSVATGYSTARISVSLKRLETRGYVRRIAERNIGAGKRFVALTPAGKRHCVLFIRRLDALQLVLGDHVYRAPSGLSGKLMTAAAILTPMAHEAEKTGTKPRKSKRPGTAS